MVAIDQRAVRRWGGRAFWSITDQGLFAGTNFLLMVLLARWLEPTAYGALATAYAAFLLLGTLHTALWTEPILVFGGGQYRDSFLSYLGILLRGHCLFSIGLAGLFAAGALVLEALAQPDLASASWGLAVAAPLTLFMWFARRVPYVRLRPAQAVQGGVLYLVLLLPSAYLLVRLGWHSVGNVLAVMGLAALLAGLWILFRVACTTTEGEGKIERDAVMASHWRYGRWAMLAGVLSWVPSSLPILVLPGFAGLEASGEFRAALNLVMPLLQTNSAVAILLIPAFAAVRGSGMHARVLVAGMMPLVFVALAYYAILIMFGSTLVSVIYADRYHAAPALLWLLGAVPIAHAVALVLGASIRARQLPNRVAASYAVSACFAAAAVVPVVQAQGVIGAAGVLLVSVIMFAVASFVAWRWREERQLA